MSLKSLSYTEFENDPQHWKLDQCDFSQINLIVGRNATGKTRLMNVINGLCKILSARTTEAFQSGTYQTEIALSGKVYSLCLEFANGQVIKESLKVDKDERLTRDADGKGKIYYEQEGKFIEFQVPPTAIAIQQRRDELQHPFVVELSKWARGCQAYLFGSSLGKDRVVGLASLEVLLEKQEGHGDVESPISTYTKAFNQYGEAFDKAVIRDMGQLGYNLTEVGMDDMRQFPLQLNLSEPLFGMFVREKDRDAKLPQMYMSQGMFRALALVIHINVASFGKQRTLVLVDDIGEGLDFERSASLIDVLTRHAKETDLQIIMTTNDRFVMNRVPLEYWSLLRRTGATVHAYTERNCPKEFAEFKYMGLSNFDFFTSATFQ